MARGNHSESGLAVGSDIASEAFVYLTLKNIKKILQLRGNNLDKPKKNIYIYIRRFTRSIYKSAKKKLITGGVQYEQNRIGCCYS